MRLAPGVVVAERYRLDQPLGRGAMGEVWAATHLAIGTRVAIKQLSGDAPGRELVTRFKREAMLLGRVRSDYVARVLDFVDDGRHGHLLVMELVAGKSLIEVLGTRRYSVREAIDLGCDVLSALADLHSAQIIHRDLKPGNLIVEPRARGPRHILVDFGMSRVQHQDSDDEMTSITRANVALGTLSYMAPEQILNSRGVTASADLYAAGAILFRAVAGYHAYAHDDDATLARMKLHDEAPALPVPDNDALGVELARIVARALGRKPSLRYATADEMLSDLERLRSPVATFLEDTTHQQPVSATSLPLALPAETSGEALSLQAVERGSASRSASGIGPSPVVARASRRGLFLALGGAAVIATLGGAGLLVSAREGPPKVASPPAESVAPPAPQRASVAVAPPPPPAALPSVATAPPPASSAAPALSAPALRVLRPNAPPPRETPPSVDGF